MGRLALELGQVSREVVAKEGALHAVVLYNREECRSVIDSTCDECVELPGAICARLGSFWRLGRGVR